MNYNKTLYRDLGDVISTKEIKNASDLKDLDQFFDSIDDMPNDAKVYISVENGLFEVSGVSIQFIQSDKPYFNDYYYNKVICINAKLPDWISQYADMDMDQLISEFGKQNSRKAAAMYKKTNFKIVSDAEDRMNYIQERLRELRFGKRDK